MKKTLISLVIVIIIALGALKIVMNLSWPDRPAPHDADLAIERIELPPEDNAYTYFNAATNTFYWPTNATLIADYLEGKTVATRLITDILDRNTSTLASIQEGIARRKCVTPAVRGLEAPTPEIRPWLNIGKVLMVKTRYHRLAGQHVQATETCILLLQFGDLLQQNPESLIQHLTGIAIRGFGLTQAQELARDPHLPSAELSRLSATLAKLSPSAPGLARAIKTEYQMVADTIDQFHNGAYGTAELTRLVDHKPSLSTKRKRLSPYLLQPNATKETFANYYREVIANIPLPHSQMKSFDIEKAFGLNKSQARQVLRLNTIGRLFYALFPLGVNKMLQNRCRADCDLAATQIIVACRQYQQERHNLPDHLEALVPAYLAAIPTDPFDGQPFRYNAAQKIIYSVGQDLQDSGGSTQVPEGTIATQPSARRWEANDAVYEIE